MRHDRWVISPLGLLSEVPTPGPAAGCLEEGRSSLILSSAGGAVQEQDPQGGPWAGSAALGSHLGLPQLLSPEVTPGTAGSGDKTGVRDGMSSPAVGH